jgi:hypothetical protein
MQAIIISYDLIITSQFRGVDRLFSCQTTYELPQKFVTKRFGLESLY